MFKEKRIPGLRGYFARSDGTIRTPYGNVLRGSVGNESGHLRINCSSQKKWVHRLIASAFVKNPRPDIFWIVDHINQNEQDNRPENLRWCNHSINLLNNSALGASFVSNAWANGKKYKVRKWRAYVTVSKKRHHLGLYKTFREAHLVSKKFREDSLSRIYSSFINETPRAGRYILGF